MTKAISGFLLLLLVLGLGTAWLFGQNPSTVPVVLQPPTFVPNTITPNVPTSVIVSVLIPDPRLISLSVNLLRIGSDGSSTKVAQMKDDGTDGDVRANDKVFTATVPFNEQRVGSIVLQVSAGMTGAIRRSLSPSGILVVDPVVGPGGGTIIYPDGIVLTVPPGALLKPVALDIYLRNTDRPATIPSTAPTYAVLEISPRRVAASGAEPVASSSFALDVALPIERQLPPGTELLLLEPTPSRTNWRPTGEYATVGANGANASFRTHKIGTLLLVRASDRGLEDVH